jgi:hypothetical protein
VTIRRIDPLSLAKIAAVLNAVVGVLFGAGLYFTSSILRPNASYPSHGLGAYGGAVALVLLPALYGTLGFLGSLLGAWVYNLIAGAIGGVILEIE